MSDERFNLPSASSFSADYHCPGRQNLLRELREQGVVELDDPAMRELADRGVRIHAARATGNTLNLTADELDAYTKACALERQAVEDWRNEHEIADLPDLVIEERLWLHDDRLRPILSGQLDIFHKSGTHGLLCDYKTGSAYYVESAARNWQTRLYSLLAWKEWPQLKRIRVALIMPERFGDKTDLADFTEYDLAHIEQAVRHALWRSLQPDAELRAGSHCRFCAARGQCPAAARMATLPAVTGNGDPLSLVRAMPAQDLATVFRKKALVTQVFEAISQRLSALSDEELAGIGLKRTKGKKLDKIKDTVGAYAKLAGQGLSEPDLLQAMTFNKERLVQLLARDRNCREERAAEIWGELLDEFIERGRGNPSLVESKP